MRIDIMTLFPDTVGDMLCESILGRGRSVGSSAWSATR
jgi:tRNA (guanine37-N1)-methyltransferase